MSRPPVVLVPAYEPDGRLLELLTALQGRHPVVLVDDGSGPAYAPVFTAARRLGADLVTLDVNRGKGAALKAGLARIRAAHPGAAVVCADSDGQHRPDDLARVAAVLTGPASGRTEGSAGEDAMVLGVRAFSGTVPIRSRLGNAVTSRVFGWATGLTVRDTQTGLRGYPAALLPWLQEVPGDRFEYELNVLLQAAGRGIQVRQVEIATVYLDDNASSHFRPLLDSARVYLPLLRFAASSLAAFALDVALLFTLMAMTGQLAVSVVGARLLSATANFAVNRTVVFKARADTAQGAGDEQRPSVWSAARGYALLAVAVLVANLALMTLLDDVLGMPLGLAKVITEAALFVAGYQVQQKVVFAPSAHRRQHRSHRHRPAHRALTEPGLGLHPGHHQVQPGDPQQPLEPLGGLGDDDPAPEVASPLVQPGQHAEAGRVEDLGLAEVQHQVALTGQQQPLQCRPDLRDGAHPQRAAQGRLATG